LDQNEQTLKKIEEIRDNLTRGGKVVLTQHEMASIYRVQCTSPSCRKVFYEFVAMPHCPHCAAEMLDTEEEVKINVDILLNTRTGQLSIGSRKIAVD
jgi:hypothetical protein